MSREVLWYERIDRRLELDAVRTLIPSGGCLVLQGDRSRGIDQATSLCSAFLRDFGYECTHVSLTGRTGGIRDFIVAAIESLRPPSDGFHLSAAAETANLTDHDVMTTCAEILSDRPSHAVLFENIDRTVTPETHRMFLFGQLAKQAAQPVIVTCSREHAWPSAGGVSSLILKEFNVADVRAKLMSAPELGHKTSHELESALEAVFPSATSDQATVAPRDAYLFLQTLSKVSM